MRKNSFYTSYIPLSKNNKLLQVFQQIEFTKLYHFNKYALLIHYKKKGLQCIRKGYTYTLKVLRLRKSFCESIF